LIRKNNLYVHITKISTIHLQRVATLPYENGKSKHVTHFDSIPFHLFCEENSCQNATVNSATVAVLKYTNVKVD